MILSGAQHINIRPNGRMLLSMVMVTLIFAILMCSCSSYTLVGDGRGDWSHELCGGYYLVKVNSKCISLTYKENSNDSFTEYVLPPFFVTSYQLHKPYICVEGILTEGSFATEKELSEKKVTYYIVNYESNEIIGPFESYDEFFSQCESLAIKLNIHWNSTQDIEQSKQLGDG